MRIFRSLLVLTHHLDLSARGICVLYRKRWAVENCFRTIKRQWHLREYAAANANAVMIVILCPLMAYGLAQAVIFVTNQPVTLAEAIQMLQTLSTAVFTALARALHPGASSALQPPPPSEASPLIVAWLLTP